MVEKDGVAGEEELAGQSDHGVVDRQHRRPLRNRVVGTRVRGAGFPVDDALGAEAAAGRQFLERRPQGQREPGTALPAPEFRDQRVLALYACQVLGRQIDTALVLDRQPLDRVGVLAKADAQAFPPAVAVALGHDVAGPGETDRYQASGLAVDLGWGECPISDEAALDPLAGPVDETARGRGLGRGRCDGRSGHRDDKDQAAKRTDVDHGQTIDDRAYVGRLARGTLPICRTAIRRDAEGALVSLRDTYLESDGLELARLLRSGDLAPAEAVECAAAIASELNGSLNAIVYSDFERAVEAAPEAVAAGGPFAGVPYLLKDLYAAADGLPMTNGSRLFASNVPDHDSEMVRRYRRAGLVIAGRSASPEFGLTTSTESAIFGQTRNPWNLEHIAGGSSGGAAAAVAAGIVPAAHASDGGGSIRIPASCCGLFGLKPSRARVSLAPDAGEGWAGLSIQHCVSRTVRDSAALLDAVAGPVAGDPYAAPAPERPFLEEVGREPGRLRIALTTRAFNGSEVHPSCVAAAEKTARLCLELGHEVEEAAPEIDAVALGNATRLIVAANIRATVAERSEALGREPREDELEPMTWAMASVAEDHDVADYVRATRTVHAVGRQVAAFFSDGYDVLLSPTMAAPPEKLGVLSLSNRGDDYLPALLQTIGFTQLMNVSGNPAASVPLYWTDSYGGLPIGVQFAAPMGGEGQLLRLSSQLEGARPWAFRKPPCSAWSES